MDELDVLRVLARRILFEAQRRDGRWMHANADDKFDAVESVIYDLLKTVRKEDE